MATKKSTAPKRAAVSGARAANEGGGGGIDDALLASYSRTLRAIPWKLEDAAKVLARKPLALTHKHGGVEWNEVRESWYRLREALKAGELLPAEPVRVVETKRDLVYPSRSAVDTAMRFGRSDEDVRVRLAKPKVREASTTTHWLEAKVLPSEVVAWLNRTGDAINARLFGAVVDALGVGFEAIEPGDSPKNLSLASPDALRAWIAANWAAVESTQPKTFGQRIIKKLMVGGFTEKEARALHAATKPDWYKPGNKKQAGAR